MDSGLRRNDEFLSRTGRNLRRKSCNNPPINEPEKTNILKAQQNTRWKPHNCHLRSDVPGNMLCWLLDSASLTKRLKQLSGGDFKVRVLSQGWQRPRLDEESSLGSRAGCITLVRHVQLICKGQPWVFARTVIPVSSMRGRLKQLAHLGDRPLGAVLFADPGMRRGVVELARITPGQALFADATADLAKQPNEIWGRRSVFRIANHPLLVSELFLPSFPAVSRYCPPGKSAWDRVYE